MASSIRAGISRSPKKIRCSLGMTKNNNPIDLSRMTLRFRVAVHRTKCWYCMKIQHSHIGSNSGCTALTDVSTVKTSRPNHQRTTNIKRQPSQPQQHHPTPDEFDDDDDEESVIISTNTTKNHSYTEINAHHLSGTTTNSKRCCCCYYNYHRSNCAIASTMTFATIISIFLTTMMALVMSAWHLLWTKHPSYPVRRVELKFNHKTNYTTNSSSTNRTFKIIQLTDLHYGENPYTDWGPMQDTNTSRLINTIIQHESPIDLIIISGDQITGNNINGNATAYYEHICQLVENHTIPYAIIFGNHDDATFETDGTNNNNNIYQNTTLRHELMEYIMNRSTPKSYLSLSKSGPDNIYGVSNYALNVTNNNNNNNSSSTSSSGGDDTDGNDDEVVLQIMLLDSGGGSINQTIVYNQLQWYLQQRIPFTGGQEGTTTTTTSSTSNSSTTTTTTLAYIDAIAFQHIPTQQFEYNNNPNHQFCFGTNGENGIAPLQYDSANEIQFLLQYDTSLHFMAVGHNHGNSYCCRTNTNNHNNDTTTMINTNRTVGSLHLCFGRHSGYGGYGFWVRGVRVYEFQLMNDNESFLSSFRVTWQSWVRFEDGTITDMYEPFR